MLRMILGILDLLILATGVLLVFGGPIFYPDKKYEGNEVLKNHKRTKLKAVGYVVCLVAFLMGLIISSIK